MFNGYVHKLISKLGHLQPNSCVPAWNVGVRKIPGLPYTQHTWMLGPLTNYVYIKYTLFIRDLKCLPRFSQCDHVLVCSCFSLISNNANYIFGNKLAYFRDLFAIHINWCTLNDNIKKIKLSNESSHDEQLIINHIWSLLMVKSNQYSVQ